MRLLHLITRAEPGGAQTQLLSLLPGLRPYFDVTVATGEEGFLTEALHRMGVRAVVVPDLVHPIDPLRDIRALKEMRALIGRLRPVLVHAHTSKAGFLGRLAAQLCGVPAVFSAHGWTFREGASRGRRLVSAPLERMAARWSEAIITVCESDRDLALCRRIGRASRLHVVRNGLADCRWQAQPGAAVRPTVIMVARFAPPKDQALLLKAASGLRIAFDLWLIGDGPDRPAMECLASRLRMSGSVRFFGWRTDVAPMLAHAQIFVLASRFEGFPVSVLEAMRAGLPVIATDVGGVCEAVAEGETGFLVPRDDQTALRERLERLIADPALRAQMGKASRERFLRRFTVDRTVEETLRIYEAVLGVPLKKDRRSPPLAVGLQDASDLRKAEAGGLRGPSRAGSKVSDRNGTWI